MSIPKLIKQTLQSLPVRILLLAIVYFIAGRIGLASAVPPGYATAVWPASGVALAAVLLLGREVWSGIFLGSLLLNIQVTLSTPESELWQRWIAPLGIAVGSTLQALLGAMLIRESTGTIAPVGYVRDVVKFVLVAMLSCTLAATLGDLSLCLSTLVSWDRFGETWFVWWLGDFVGILVVAPVTLILSQRELRSDLRGREALADYALLLVILGLASQLIFGVPVVGALPSLPIAYTCLPLIVWTAFRLGPSTATLACFFISVVAIWGVYSGSSPFTRNRHIDPLIATQIFVAVTTVTALTMGAVLRERRRAEKLRILMLEEEKRLRLDLARSNEDLERFAHVASHDLQEPLRMITTHLGLINADKLSASEQESFRFATEGANRMKTLIHDLLEFSRLRNRGGEFRLTETSAVLQEVLANLRTSIEESEAQITLEPLPSIFANRFQLTQLFQNLISNALKYRGDSVPQIQVSCQKNLKSWLFTVQDNGMGIEEKNHGKIFQAFQRLHSRSTHPGTGLGLSVCKKIVDYHKGRIWVESKLGKGSTFYIDIPFLQSKAS